MMTQLIFIVFLCNCAETGLGIKLLVFFFFFLNNQAKFIGSNLNLQTNLSFFKLLVYIGLQLINNVVIVSGVQQSDLVVHFPI